MTSASAPRRKRLLICGPVFPSLTVGGLPLAFADVARALEAIGWEVDLAFTPDALGLPAMPDSDGFLPAWSRQQGWRPRLRFLPPDLRTLVQHVLFGGGVLRSQSDAMHALERRLAEVPYDAVIAHVYKAAPGFGRFITARHPRVLLVSLDGLAAELRLASLLALPRLVARLSRRPWHPDLFLPLGRNAGGAPVIFASPAWRDEALRAGLTAESAHVIPFGVPAPPPLSSPAPMTGRLLWAGRLSPEKGLHVFIEGVAELARRREVTLTAICGDGPVDYRASLESRIRALGLQEAVRLLPAIDRRRLERVYREHDLLLFHSAFEDPVALVLMEAFGAGLPVLAPHPRVGATLVDPGRTCICFDDESAGALARSIARALDDEPLRRRVRTAAHALIRSSFTLEAMGRAYDVALRERLATTCRRHTTVDDDSPAAPAAASAV